MGFTELMAKRAAQANAVASPENEPEEAESSAEESSGSTAENQATGMASAVGLDAVTIAVPAPAPAIVDTPVVAEVDWKKPVRFKQNFVRRIMIGGWWYPIDGYFYPETKRQKDSCMNLFKANQLTPENYTPSID